MLNVLRDAKAAGVVVDWEQIDPVYKKDITAFLNKFADALHDDNKEIWLCVQPGQELDYIDFEAISRTTSIASSRCFSTRLPTSTRPVRSDRAAGSKAGSAFCWKIPIPKQWIIALGSYGYDWTDGVPKAELISFPEAMSRASYADIAPVAVTGPDYNPLFLL